MLEKNLDTAVVLENLNDKAKNFLAAPDDEKAFKKALEEIKKAIYIANQFLEKHGCGKFSEHYEIVKRAKNGDSFERWAQPFQDD